MLKKFLWRLAALLSLLLIGIPAGDGQIARAATGDPIVVPLAVLSPAPGGLCTTYWYELPNAYQTNSAYLTQNVATQAASSNTGVWRPTLPETGFYMVEVYIPAHPAIVWNCTTSKTINSDTTAAVYKIDTGLEIFPVTVNQAASAGQWVDLGSYYFHAGTTGSVTLTDLTTGAAFANTVSFSAARFTPNPKATRLLTPLISFRGPSVNNLSFSLVQAVGRDQAAHTRFDAFEPVVYKLSGENNGPEATSAGLTWSLAGPCGAGVLAEHTPALPVGAWTASFTTTIPACTGTYTVTAQISGTILSQSLAYNVDAGGEVKVFTNPMFDMSSLPSLQNMQTWWASSPYRGIGIYLGGASFCSTCTFVRDLTFDWIKSAQKMGWSFLPVWVGPQAPCTTRNTAKISADPAAAYQEGKDQALLAYSAAIRLGLTSGLDMSTIIYYDMEAYPNQAACHTAVGQFLTGWTEQLHVFGLKSGAYGLPASANYGNWAGLTPPPDAVWLATYVRQGYSSSLTVFDIPNYSTSLFANHQRVFQYSGDFKETWGGTSMTIDSNIADAPLLVSRWPAAASPDVRPLSAVTVQVHDRVGSFQIIDASQGWVISDSRLYWTADAGRTWQEHPLPAALTAGLSLEQAYFLSPTLGWILARSESGLVLLHTGDGQEWDIRTLPDLDAASAAGMVFDASGGSLALRQPGLMPGGEVTVLQTENQGITWDAVTADLVMDLVVPARPKSSRSTTPQTPWRLEIGDGLSFNAFSGMAFDASLVSPKVMTLPAGADMVALVSPTRAWASTFNGNCRGEKGTEDFFCNIQTALWSTTDGGATWTLLVK